MFTDHRVKTTDMFNDHRVKTTDRFTDHMVALEGYLRHYPAPNFPLPDFLPPQLFL